MRTRWLLIASAAIIGCYHYPHEALLLALSRDAGPNLFENPQPKYLGFADQRTAFIFERLTHDGRYQPAPEETSLICPGVAANGMHGYMLHVSVDSVMGDSAIATLTQTCSRERACPTAAETCATIYSGSVVSTTSYLLVRKYGAWNVAKPLGGGVNHL
ncbi:MAG: hypothetical protein DMD72_04380 [Gemmatimonadetes bacterium]|nr:MAG: hypothetical protein DMD72_04380 [Gemmatimonadota bacterium]PYO76784.1 MAG: hypothetical protein DMD63_13460 [Gemmatimonadota bacterium]